MIHPTRRLLAAVIAISVLAPAGSVIAQSAQPSTSAAAPEAADPGATDEVYRDAFDTAPGWLDVGEDESGRTAIEDGRVFMSVIGAGTNYWDGFVLPDAAGAIRVEATVGLDGTATTGAGPACGSATGLPRWFVAGVSGEAGWWLGRLIDGRLQVVERGDLPVEASERSGVRVAIECVSAPAAGGDYVLVAIDDVVVSQSMPVLDIPVGPYDKATLFVATDAEQGSATFDDLIVHIGDASPT